MASFVVTSITSSQTIGVVRVLTPEFLQLRQNYLRTHQSDSEDVRWVSKHIVK